jgi:hypothetical protein
MPSHVIIIAMAGSPEIKGFLNFDLPHFALLCAAHPILFSGQHGVIKVGGLGLGFVVFFGGSAPE